jgi:superfamily I DNA and RNA helicase
VIDVIWGSAQEKPISSRSLAEEISTDPNTTGYLYIGYPVIAAPTGPVKLDALLVSPERGLVAFDLVEGTDIGEFQSRQDEIASMLEVRLKPHAGLKSGRSLRFDVNVITYAGAKLLLPPTQPPYFFANRANILTVLHGFNWAAPIGVYTTLVAAIQVVTSIRAGRQRREPKKPDSRGAKLKRIEESIANLDQHQSEAVIETVEGIQRIRGLAGSGKTIVLALKVAYLHAQNPTWRIAVTFNTRSLKEQFRRLINNFTIEQTGTEPDWDCIEIINAWGAPGARDRDGIYHKFCRSNQVPFHDFASAKRKFGEGNEFRGACTEALAAAKNPEALYDLILIDEAQDLPPEFIRLCYNALSAPGRLVYAYDELQSLTGSSVLPPEELFGNRPDGVPLFNRNHDDTGPRQDIILEKCYRNSRPLLATAHALGFGIYRQQGLVQIFDNDALWTEVGYKVENGELAPGQMVSLARTSDTSPRFLEDHSDLQELIQFHRFQNQDEQTQWLIESILKDIREQELRPEDVVVINPNPLTTQKEVGPIRQMLFAHGINSELAGVSTSADIFTTTDCVTFTGIFRAKGNEAGMVYIINAHDCASGWNKAATALVRNRLFTSITRSKAWVRILGIGPQMDILSSEWDLLRQNNYELRFRYPTEEEKKQLRIINRDLQIKGKVSRRGSLSKQREQLLEAVSRGELDPDKLIKDLETIKHASDKK